MAKAMVVEMALQMAFWRALDLVPLVEREMATSMGSQMAPELAGLMESPLVLELGLALGLVLEREFLRQG